MMKNIAKASLEMLSIVGAMLLMMHQSAFSQNSSLFQRPVQFASQNSEVLPSPSRGFADPTIGNLSMANVNMANQNGTVPAAMYGSGENVPIGQQASWTFIPPMPTRALKIHDIVQIRVEESTTSLAAGNATSRKTTSYDAVLKDWIRLVGFDTIKPAPQSDGDPRFQTTQSEVYRGDSTTRTSGSLTTNIAAEIVDIRPNGLLVLNAHRTIKDNDNIFEFSLTGTCRSADILPDNVVLSRNLIHVNIDKQERGHVRDGYSRGWITKLLARIKPF